MENNNEEKIPDIIQNCYLKEFCFNLKSNSDPINDKLKHVIEKILPLNFNEQAKNILKIIDQNY